MVQAKELMIGSVLMHEDGQMVVIEQLHSIYAVTDRFKSISYEKLLPVLLTHDVLEKCEFVKSGIVWVNKFVIILEPIIGSEKYEMELKNGREQRNLIIIKSFHQLQNLYFALTGEELPFNLLNQ